MEKSDRSTKMNVKDWMRILFLGLFVIAIIIVVTAKLYSIISISAY